MLGGTGTGEMRVHRMYNPARPVAVPGEETGVEVAETFPKYCEGGASSAIVTPGMLTGAS